MAREWGEIVEDQWDASRMLVQEGPSIDAYSRLADGYKERLENAIEHSVRYFEEAEEWREKYLAMRRERNEAMEQWLSYMEHQWAVERHLEGHEDEVRMKIRASAMAERDRAARTLMEIFELWQLKNGVEAEDLDEAEGSV